MVDVVVHEAERQEKISCEGREEEGQNRDGTCTA